MGRKSLKIERRAEITRAFARVLAREGYAGATILAVAQEANLSAGLLHHHFRDKREMLLELLSTLLTDFRKSLNDRNTGKSRDLESYIDAALKLDDKANAIAAKCWVGILAEGLREKGLMDKIRNHLDTEIRTIESMSKGALDIEKSSALLSFILGALVFGAFAPKRTSGFAAKMGKKFLKSF
jgi:TetR/AcrR family transcriptional repressor of bet genes